MEEYKLYNVVPPLVQFLENLTNCYVRFNRSRLKGEVDDENMEVSINVLFDVLLNINILMSPHVPFLTDHMYMNMKKCVKQDGKLNQDSIHHLFIPKPIEKFQNEQINLRMQTALKIIETARRLRGNDKISLKQPIMSLTIVNSNENLLTDL
jgi:isoleucyl-tRNA synthetase